MRVGALGTPAVVPNPDAWAPYVNTRMQPGLAGGGGGGCAQHGAGRVGSAGLQKLHGSRVRELDFWWIACLMRNSSQTASWAGCVVGTALEKRNSVAVMVT